MRARGHSLAEASVVLAVLGVLALAALAGFSPGRSALAPAGLEMRGLLEQTRLLALARGRGVHARPKGGGGEVAPLRLPGGLRWGAPPNLRSLPPRMERPARALLAGEAHPLATYGPGGTANAGCWFLTDGRDALCFRLANEGVLRRFRYRSAAGTWVED
ncbi:hypothetical protein [Mesoterricola sediminis]|uniref:Uncharacterized protein n=1 Tax=Mesoterricola sediminis TaxID=2927980 RepID=A0AA48H575_9BACT|nr:hypothetical protein [Mesoterricola sediminis]BDU76183.1 hypothetical protein METESE_11410 [Mesoterricola sediminis]